MDFRFTAAQEAFRGDVRGFLKSELPGGWTGHLGDTLMSFDDEWAQAVTFTKRLARRGWVAPHWPKEYGGAGLSVMEQVVYNEEMATFGAPIVNGPGVGMVGPTLIIHGSEEQKQEHLPGITNVERIWCQGYSEPGSGSDLASVQTRAVRDGDEYIVNGQKIWTTNGHRANWMIMLARTNPEAPKHRGISMLLLDMKTPGITVRALPNMANLHTFNEVFFENVRVPAGNRVGEENRGWYYGVTLLDFERSNIAGAARAKRELQKLVAFCKESHGHGVRPLTDALVRQRLAELAIEIEVGHYISYRVASLQARGQVPGTEASCAKLFHSEISQRLSNTSVWVAQMYSQIRPESSLGTPAGEFGIDYLESVPATLAGGTSEIQRNIIATRGLGLPHA